MGGQDGYFKSDFFSKNLTRNNHPHHPFLHTNTKKESRKVKYMSSKFVRFCLHEQRGEEVNQVWNDLDWVGERGSKITENMLTSFLDGPFLQSM